jgi:hypothetical protein
MGAVPADFRMGPLFFSRRPHHPFEKNFSTEYKKRARDDARELMQIDNWKETGYGDVLYVREILFRGD